MGGTGTLPSGYPMNEWELSDRVTQLEKEIKKLKENKK